MVALVAGAAYSGDPGLIRLTKLVLFFWAGLSFVCLPICMVAYIAVQASTEKNIQEFKIANKLRSVPAWISHLYDAVVIGICAYSGWMWTAVIYLLHVPAQVVSIALIEAAAKTLKARSAIAETTKTATTQIHS